MGYPSGRMFDHSFPVGRVEAFPNFWTKPLMRHAEAKGSCLQAVGPKRSDESCADVACQDESRGN